MAAVGTVGALVSFIRFPLSGRLIECAEGTGGYSAPFQ
jgi:hypothetical protein